MKRIVRVRRLIPTIALAALLTMASGGLAQTQAETSWVDIDWSVIPGLVDAPFSVRGWPPAPGTPVRPVKQSTYEPVGTSWVDINWSVIPGLVDAPFSVRGWPPAPKPVRAHLDLATK